MNAKVGLSTVEKIEHLLELESALYEKLAKIRDNKAKEKANAKASKELKKLEKPRTSSIEETDEA